jgi:hypothetical protein
MWSTSGRLEKRKLLWEFANRHYRNTLVLVIEGDMYWLSQLERLILGDLWINHSSPSL